MGSQRPSRLVWGWPPSPEGPSHRSVWPPAGQRKTELGYRPLRVPGDTRGSDRKEPVFTTSPTLSDTTRVLSSVSRLEAPPGRDSPGDGSSSRVPELLHYTVLNSLQGVTGTSTEATRPLPWDTVPCLSPEVLGSPWSLGGDGGPGFKTGSGEPGSFPGARRLFLCRVDCGTRVGVNWDLVSGSEGPTWGLGAFVFQYLRTPTLGVSNRSLSMSS